MNPLTLRQRKALQALAQFIQKNGYAPTLEEMAREMNVSKPTAQQYVRALAQRGAIRHRRYAQRSIEIVPTNETPPSTALPLLGRIAAGHPIEAVETRETTDIADVLGLGKGKELFLLQVRGDSMIEDGIFDGDYVVVEKGQTAENGETVVALLEDGMATLKKFYREKNRIRLQPANARLSPIYSRNVVVQGIVRGVVRSVK